MDYFSIGANVRAARHSQGLTLEALAELANIGANFLGKIERGTSIPSLETIVKLANALHTSLDALLYPALQVHAGALPQTLQKTISRIPPERRTEYLELACVLAEFYVRKG